MNSADAKSVKNRTRRERRAKERFNHAVREVMTSAEGRSIVWWLLSESGISRTSYRGNALEMAFLEGQRNVGLRLQAAVLEVCPDLYALAQDEASKFQKRENDAELAQFNPEQEVSSD